MRIKLLPIRCRKFEKEKFTVGEPTIGKDRTIFKEQIIKLKGDKTNFEVETVIIEEEVTVLNMEKIALFDDTVIFKGEPTPVEVETSIFEDIYFFEAEMKTFGEEGL